MINTPEVIKNLFLQDGIRKNFRVTFPDNPEIPDIISKNIVQGSIHFTESSCSQEEFKFGLCEASEIEFECYNVGNIKKKKIKCFVEIDLTSLSDSVKEEYGQTSDDLDYIFYRISLGVFRVTACPKVELDVEENAEFDGTILVKRSITAYGPSYDFSWNMNEFEQGKINNSDGTVGDIDVFRWMFTNYMQNAWQLFFTEDDFTLAELNRYSSKQMTLELNTKEFSNSLNYVGHQNIY